ncbi:MAG: methylated-DNA--[protein]-cysteine S-methyltransferase [Pseudomonadota bacterium]|nr:methylated-DNA--[protein]-cysteine S-methyltransferase [Pseudomonadota bacterium]
MTTLTHISHLPAHRLTIAYTDAGVVSIEFSDMPLASESMPSTSDSPQFLAVLRQKMNAYLHGQSQVDFTTIPLALSDASQFQLRVWQAVKRIPYGQVCSYQDVARKIGNKHAARAVGRALATNPVLIVIPCHRVLTSGGNLGGYRAGTELKKKLLTLEAPNHNHSYSGGNSYV